MLSRTLRGAAMGALLGICLSAHASVVVSVDRAAFQAAVASATIAQQDFDGLANGTVLGTLGDVTYGASTGSPLVTNTFLTSTSPNGLGRTGVGFFLRADTATFTFAAPITAFAIDINTFGNLLGDYSALLGSGDVVTSLNEVFPNQSTGQFIGFTSNTAFDSVTIRANLGSPSQNLSYTLDTLVYGSAAAVQQVPEPAALVLALTGLGLLATAHPVRRRAARS